MKMKQGFWGLLIWIMVLLPMVQVNASGKYVLSKKEMVTCVKRKETLSLYQKKKNYYITVSGEVQWSSSNKKVATVKNGVVTGKKAGKATITAKHKGKKYRCRVVVRKLKTLRANYSKKVTFRGKLKTVTGIHAGNGMKISNTVLVLEKPVRLIYKAEDTYDLILEELVLGGKNVNLIKGMKGKVQIKGRLYPALSAWYLRDFALEAESVKGL